MHIVGGGLAGTEAAWQAANAGVRVTLWEMRPHRLTPAHKTGDFAELVCSNSLKSESPNTAPWLLKQELRRCGSLAMMAAQEARVPGGQALTVDRAVFSAAIERRLAEHPLIEIRREELASVPENDVTIIASGPLTSEELAADIGQLTGSSHLYFYDAISPIVDAESIDFNVAFRASRYGRSLDG